MRQEYRENGFFGPFRSREGKGDKARFPNFPRALPGSRSRRVGLNAIVKAGYRFASLQNPESWTPAHAWLRENCTNAYGLKYTWSGGTFFFEDPADHAAFMEAFECADGYKPMFAFETGR